MADKKRRDAMFDPDALSLWAKRIVFWAIGIGVFYNLVTKVFM